MAAGCPARAQSILPPCLADLQKYRGKSLIAAHRRCPDSLTTPSHFATPHLPSLRLLLSIILSHLPPLYPHHRLLPPPRCPFSLPSPRPHPKIPRPNSRCGASNRRRRRSRGGGGRGSRSFCRCVQRPRQHVHQSVRRLLLPFEKTFFLEIIARFRLLLFALDTGVSS